MRSRLLTIALTSGFLVLVVLLGGDRPRTSAAQDHVDVIITFRDVPGAAEQAAVRGLGGRVKGAYSIVPAVAASLPAASVDALRRNPRVVAVEPDIEAQAFHLNDSGDPAEVANAWGVDRLDANVVWQTTTGAGVGIAIVDTGSGPHPDLPAAVVRVNCLSGACVAGGNDDNGHGTHVAGSALALQNNAGVAGVAPGASLFSYKVLNASGSGSFSNIIAALDHIVAYNAGGGTPRVRVANFSLGSSAHPGSAVETAFNNAYAAGVLSVAAAGNSGQWPYPPFDSVAYPARFASVVAVAATTTSDGRASYSGRGPDLELAAPGHNVNSTWLNNGYAVKSGTSMASPHASGAAALVFAGAGLVDANGVNGLADEVRNRLNGTAKDLGTAGRDSSFGFGLVNPERAVRGSNSHSPY